MAFYPINEVYFGRSDDIKDLMNMISEFRKKYLTGSIWRYNPAINQDKKLYAINRKFEDVFGYKEFALSIMNSTIANAFTVPIGGILDPNPRKYIIKTSNGYKYKKESGYGAIVYITTGIFMNPAFTDEEIFALILHEVGHTFQNAINNNMQTMSACGRFMELILGAIDKFSKLNITNAPKFEETIGMIAGESNFFTKMRIFITKILATDTPFATILNTIGTVGSVVKDIAMSVSNVVLGLTPFAAWRQTKDLAIQKGTTILARPITHARNIVGELTADSFAALYGYAPQLASALNKMHAEPGTEGVAMNLIDNNIVLRTIRSVNMLPFNVINYVLDPHPTDIARQDMTINTLEKELEASNLDPKVKKNIKEDIEAVQKQIDNTVKKAEKLDLTQKDFLFQLYQALLYKGIKSDTNTWLPKHLLGINKKTNIGLQSIVDDKLPMTKVQLK